MSVARVNTVNKAAKDQGTCGRCGKPLPKGEPYLWYTVGFRSDYKHKRCLDPACYPRESERDTSKYATVLAAIESFNDNIDSLTEIDEVEQAVQDVAEAIAEVRDEYQEALDAWENGNEQLQEKVDHYEEQESELAYWEYDGEQEAYPCDEHDEGGELVEGCEQCEANRDEWLENLREAARDAVSNVEPA